MLIDEVSAWHMVDTAMLPHFVCATTHPASCSFLGPSSTSSPISATTLKGSSVKYERGKDRSSDGEIMARGLMH